MTYVENYFDEVTKIVKLLNTSEIEKLAGQLAKLRDDGGRLFFIGVGGSAANASHAVNDFRKLCAIEAYAPTDNVAELTARTNDEGWDTTFSAWLECSKANDRDAVFVLSVGGGNIEHNISPNIVKGLKEAKSRKMKIFGIVGRNGGYTKEIGDTVIIVPTVSDDRITPHSEAFQAVIWHCLSCHPALSKNSNKWESVNKG